VKIVQQAEIKSLFNSCSNLFISPEWLNVISKTYGIVFKAVVSNDQQTILPFCEIENGFYPAIKSIPFGDYTLNNCSQVALNHAMKLLASTYPDCYIETSVVSKTPPKVDGFSSTKYGFLSQVDIQKWRESRDWKEAYERNIRNALNYGLTVQINRDKNALQGFYQLHEHLRVNKFKKLPQPFGFFTNIHHELIEHEKGFLLEAWNKSNLIASWLILSHHETLYYKMGASDPDHLHLRPNDLLFRSLMQYGSDNGFKTIDLGFSGAAKSYEGLIRFKSKEGGDKTPIYRVERYPENFDMNLLAKRTEYLTGLTKKAIDSNDLAFIKETSERHYGEFA